jgi:hypothetical protein
MDSFKCNGGHDEFADAQFVAICMRSVAEAISSPPGRNTVRPLFIRPAYLELQRNEIGEAAGGTLGRQVHRCSGSLTAILLVTLIALAVIAQLIGVGPF